MRGKKGWATLFATKRYESLVKKIAPLLKSAKIIIGLYIHKKVQNKPSNSLCHNVGFYVGRYCQLSSICLNWQAMSIRGILMTSFFYSCKSKKNIVLCGQRTPIINWLIIQTTKNLFKYLHRFVDLLEALFFSRSGFGF